MNFGTDYREHVSLEEITRTAAVCIGLMILPACGPGPAGSDDDGPQENVCGDGAWERAEFCFTSAPVTGLDGPTGAAYVDGRLGVAHGNDIAFSLVGADPGGGAWRVLDSSGTDHMWYGPALVLPGYFEDGGDLDFLLVAGPRLTVFHRAGNEIEGSQNLDLDPFLDGVAVIDVDGDGLSELFVGRGAEGRTWSQDDGIWSESGNAVPLPACGEVHASLSVDIDGDEQSELLVLGYPTSLGICTDSQGAVYDSEFHRIAVLDGSSEGGLFVADTIAAGNLAEFLAAGDFDGDGRLDLAVSSNDIEPSVMLHRGVGSGVFADPIELDQLEPAPGGPIVVGDFDGNGDDELIVHGASLLLFDDPFGAVTRHDLGLSGISLAVDDLNGDSVDDLVLRTPDSHLQLALSNP